MTEKEAHGFEKSGAAAMIADLHRNKGTVLVRQAARGMLGVEDAPRALDDIDDPAENARARSREMMRMMLAGEIPANKLDEELDVRKEGDVAPSIRKTAFADTWLPGRLGTMRADEAAAERAKLARRVAAREGR